MRILDLFRNASLTKSKTIRPYIIAEAGVNHEGSMETAKHLIDLAKEGGADAIKFQTYKAETLASKISPAYWDTSEEKTDTQFELFSKHDKFWKDEMLKLKEYCDVVGIEFMSTPFDIESATFLNEMMDVFKISSSDITNKPFIKYISSLGKPIILSTGASHLHEIYEALSWIKEKNNPTALLHCVLNYPTADKNANLGMIKGLKESFPNNIIGYSDHTLPKDLETLKAATLLGSMIIEKHFTHDKNLPGNDHYHSMDVSDLKKFLKIIDDLEILIGTFDVQASENEIPAIKNARRSLVASMDIKKGQILTEDMLTFKRPASGVSPKYIDKIIGMTATKEIPEDTTIKWDMLEDSFEIKS